MPSSLPGEDGGGVLLLLLLLSPSVRTWRCWKGSGGASRLSEAEAGAGAVKKTSSSAAAATRPMERMMKYWLAFSLSILSRVLRSCEKRRRSRFLCYEATAGECRT